MAKKRSDPIIDCFVETDSSFGTGRKANMSIVLSILIPIFGLLS